MNNFDVDNVFTEKTVKRIAAGLQQYQAIMRLKQNIDEKSLEEFQKKVNGFYKIIRRSHVWYDNYYSLFVSLLQDKTKAETITFEKIVRELFSRTGRIESSFSSKMLATINPNMPILDKYSLAAMEIKVPSKWRKSKIQLLDDAISTYDCVIKWYDNLEKETSLYKAVVDKFDEHFPNSGITDVKKIDFVLWQMRG